MTTAKEPELLPASIAPKVPKDFVTAPLFPSKKQKEPREIMVGDVKWEIGIPEPSTDQTPSPALDISHLRACFTLLSFRDPSKPELDIHFSMNEFCKRYADSRGGRYGRELLDIILNLRKTWISRTLPNGDLHEFTILGRVDVYRKIPRKKNTKLANPNQRELWLDCVTLHPYFFTILVDTARIRLDVLNSITSRLAQSIYSYIPSRAVHHTKTDPFEITATKLLEQLAENVPPHKSRRLEKFKGAKKDRKSVIEQLDGLELINGRLRVDIAQTADKSDWKLLFWAEDVKQIETLPKVAVKGSQSKLLNFYINHRGTKQQFNQLMKKCTPLDYYQTDMLKMAGIDYKGSESFFEMVKAIIGEGHFNMILAEFKNDVNEGRSGIKEPAKVLNLRLMYAIENPSRPLVLCQKK